MVLKQDNEPQHVSNICAWGTKHLINVPINCFNDGLIAAIYSTVYVRAIFCIMLLKQFKKNQLILAINT